MGKFDRYFLSQLTVFFGFIAVVLVLLYWINRAVRLFDWLIASGQSAVVFLEFTVLSLPNVIRLVLPVAAFVATLYTTNRLASESELVVVQANGFSPYRLARPVFMFGILVALLMSLLVHFAVPTSHARLAQRQLEVSEDMTAQFLVEGQFVHPTDGMTLFIQEITGSGRLREVYMRDSRNEEQHMTYTATEALLVRTETGPRLVMYDGMVQSLTLADRRLSLTRFDDFAIDVASLIGGPDGPTSTRRTWRDASTIDLLFGDRAFASTIRASINRIRVEGHARLAAPIMTIVAPLMAFGMMVLGGFSRFGLRWQIAGAVVLVVLIYVLDNAMEDMARSTPGGWPFVYVAPGLGALLSLILLWMAAHPGLFRRRSGVSA